MSTMVGVITPIYYVVPRYLSNRNTYAVASNECSGRPFSTIPQGASRESASYPARRCLTAIFRARVEGDGRLRRHTMDGVDHCFKQYEPIAREADTGADHYTVVDVAGQEAFNRRNCGLVGFDEAVLGMPAPPCEIGQREFDPSVDLLRGHAWWQRRVRKVHRRRIKTDKEDAFHWPSKAAALVC